MSVSLYLHCAATNESVEVLIVGSRPMQRLQPNAMGAFLAYHANQGIKGSNDFSLRNIDDNDLEDVLTWTEENYRDLIARDPKVASAQAEFEQAPSGGVWCLGRANTN